MRRAFVVMVGLGAFAAACQLLAGIDRVDKDDVPIPEAAAPEAAAPEAAAPPDPCVHVFAPAPPTLDDAPDLVIGDASDGDLNGQLYFALRKVNLVAPPGDPPLGFDLDEVCTCTTGVGAKHGGGPSCGLDSGKEMACDADGGVDNKLIEVVSRFAGLVDVDKGANINARIDKGQQNGVILITKYNGRANDKDIGVGLFTSEGILDDDAGTGAPGYQPACPDSGLADGFWSPGWCGVDRWSVSSATVNQSGARFQPKVLGSGYVTSFTFVVRFEGGAQVPFAGYHLEIGAPVSIGRLVPLDASQQPLDLARVDAGLVPAFWRIEGGVIAGRVPTHEILAAIGTFAQPGTVGDGGRQSHFCSSGLFTSLLKAAICPAIDINSSRTLDFDPKASCDAISTALSFRADPVRMDRIVTVPVDDNECFPADDGGGPIGVPGVTYDCP